MPKMTKMPNNGSAKKKKCGTQTKSAVKNVKKKAEKKPMPIKTATKVTSVKSSGALLKSKTKVTAVLKNKKVEAKPVAKALIKPIAKQAKQQEKTNAQILQVIIEKPAVVTATKQETQPKKRENSRVEAAALQQLTEIGKKWAKFYRKERDKKAEPYDMTKQYEEKTPIEHKVLGWGFILSNRNNRLEVLFRDGIKSLISNYRRENPV